MENLHAFVLALVQGLTEFLPISSSAHLILMPVLVEWPDQGLAFDVAVHFGTLAAVVFYFRDELHYMALSWMRSIRAHHAADTDEAACLLAEAIAQHGLGQPEAATTFAAALDAARRQPRQDPTRGMLMNLAQRAFR